MAWGSKTSATQLTSITTEQFFSTVITLNPGEAADCQVSFNPPATPTDDLLVKVYATLDASSETWDTTPFMQFRISRSIDPNIQSFIVDGVYRFRVGVSRSGSTDTITSADFSYRTNGLSL